MAPTIFREGSFRFFSFSREETRMHVHVNHPDGEAKILVSAGIGSGNEHRAFAQAIKEAQNLVTWRKLSMAGKRTSQAEITHVSQHGFWLLLANEEFFLPFAGFPWFRGASIEQLCQVEWPTENHLFWPSLDIDLSVESIRNPSAFPLMAAIPAPDTAVKRDAPKATRP